MSLAVVFSDVHIGDNSNTCWYQKKYHEGYLKAALKWVENNKQVSVHFVFATARISLIWTILLSLAIGLLAGLLSSQLYRRRRRRGAAPKAG